MNRIISCFWLSVLTVSPTAFGQVQELGDTTSALYERADSVALTFGKPANLTTKDLSRGLTQDLEGEEVRFRALFRWITANIDYRYGTTGKDPEKVLRRGKAVCEGYAALLQKLCDDSGIECQTITGLAKSIATAHISQDVKQMRHAWNAVKLNGKWQLIDVTWASGGINLRTKKYIRSLDEGWYMVPPERFALSHYPDKEDWFLGAKHPDRSVFIDAPLFSRYYSARKLVLQEPLKGSVGRKVKLSLLAPDGLSSISLRLADGSLLMPLRQESTGNEYWVEYLLDKSYSGEVEVLVDGHWAFSLVKK